MPEGEYLNGLLGQGGSSWHISGHRRIIRGPFAYRSVGWQNLQCSLGSYCSSNPKGESINIVFVQCGPPGIISVVNDNP